MAKRGFALSVTDGSRALLRERAAGVLHGNDAGGWTRASPRLYPHQWSWDSAFIAIGWAHLDVRRAMFELEQLFAAQWPTGMVPHIVFRAGDRGAVLPRAAVVGLRPGSRRPGLPVETTGICQPPVHALAVRRIWELTPPALRPEIRERIRALFPQLVSWHRYLATAARPRGVRAGHHLSTRGRARTTPRAGTARWRASRWPGPAPIPAWTPAS